MMCEKNQHFRDRTKRLFPIAVFGFKVEFRGLLFSDAPNFQYGIQVQDFVHMPISSSGVQITGAAKPDARQACSIRGNSCALLMCVQFQVRRKSIR